MRNGKKILALALSAAMALFLLAGCGDKASGDNSSSAGRLTHSSRPLNT